MFSKIFWIGQIGHVCQGMTGSELDATPLWAQSCKSETFKWNEWVADLDSGGLRKTHSGRASQPTLDGTRFKIKQEMAKQ